MGVAIISLHGMLRSSQIVTLGSHALSFLATWQGLYVVSIGAAALLLRIRYQKNLREIPGPFWASVLPFDRLATSASGQPATKTYRVPREIPPNCEGWS